MLRTRLSDLVGIDVPVIQAGMSTFTSARLAAAVSNVGALGSLGAWQRPAEQLRRDLDELRDATDRPFAVNHVVPDLDSALVRTIPDSANLRLLTAWLDVAMRQIALDRDAACIAGRMAIDLLHSAIARSRGDASDSREIILLRVKDFLERNLGDSDLTLDTVARAKKFSCATCTCCLRAAAKRLGGICAGAAWNVPSICCSGPDRSCRLPRWRRAAVLTARRRLAARTVAGSGLRLVRAGAGSLLCEVCTPGQVLCSPRHDRALGGVPA